MIELVEVEVEIGIEVSGGGDDRRVNLSRGKELRDVGSITIVDLPVDPSESCRARTGVER